MSDKATAASRYKTLATGRETFLREARRCSELTIPYLVPPEGAGSSWEPETPYQSVGSRGVNNLAAKLLLALLPPNTPFFRLAVDVFEMKKIAKDARLKSQLEASLSEIEQAVMVEIETTATRTTASQVFLHLLVAGNALLHVTDEGPLKVHRLDRYVVDRDPMGNVLTIILHEQVSPKVLPKEVTKGMKKEDADKVLDLYTVCERSAAGKKWTVYQEARGIRLADTEGSYPEDKCPFIPLRFIKIDGEDYGRGYVEQYKGDLVSLENLSCALSQGAVAASKILFLVNPNGVTQAKRLSDARNGAFVQGRKEDVTCLQLDKYADFQFVFQHAQGIERRLEMAFLLTTGVQRQAERVTAEEIRSLVQELETSLGGIYSVLAQDFQLPLANALMARMARDKRMPALPKKVVRPSVTTGIEALGRGNDLQKLRSFAAVLKETLPPEQVGTYLNSSEFITRAATALAISTKGLVKTEEEVQAQQQQAQQMAFAQGAVEKLGPEAMRQLGAAQQPQAPA
jgi:hypothetical protein